MKNGTFSFSEFAVDNCDVCKTLHKRVGVMHHHLGVPAVFECVNCVPPKRAAFIAAELQRMYAEEGVAR